MGLRTRCREVTSQCGPGYGENVAEKGQRKVEEWELEMHFESFN